jgi:Leucine-rich repeat (LRR) protein
LQAAGSAVLIDYLGRLYAAGPPPGREGLPEAFRGKSRALNLDRLGLDQVPPYVYGLGYLEGLSARGNRLAHLAPEVGLLRGLRRLDLEGNAVRRLPLELCLCTALEDLGLALNAWEEPPPEVREGGCEVVLRYLRAQYLAPKVVDAPGRAPRAGVPCAADHSACILEPHRS